MRTTTRQRLARSSLVILCMAVWVTGCSRTDPAPATTATTNTTTSAPAANAQATVPPPPGDSTPKAADSSTRQAMESNEGKTSKDSQSTVGTAASGAPPYTLNGAPEGNTAPSQGQKADEPAKK